MQYDREYWSQESLRFTQPHFRLLKTANIINDIARGRSLDLLDVGCGPATLSKLLQKNISYHGIDLFIHEPAPNLIQEDLLRNEIKFRDQVFDMICAFGFFEYMGNLQHKKLSEIDLILKPGGQFITSFNNFSHLHPLNTPAYSNMISIEDFLADLKSLFHVSSVYPTSYNWIATEPRREWLRRIQMPLRLNIPVLNNAFGVQFIFICSKRS
jgi:SAM-dependent methyltransferase